ncbi:MAG: hypothetical protein AABY52_04675 [Deltaproteobacteria bacterium]
MSKWREYRAGHIRRNYGRKRPPLSSGEWIMPKSERIAAAKKQKAKLEVKILINFSL